MPETQTDLAQHVAWLKQLLPPHHVLTRTRRAWYLRRWDAGWARYIDVAQDTDLPALLARLREGPRE